VIFFHERHEKHEHFYLFVWFVEENPGIRKKNRHPVLLL